MRFIFQLFAYGHIHNVVSTLANIVKLNVENHNVVSTLFNVVNISFEIENVITQYYSLALIKDNLILDKFCPLFVKEIV